MMATTNPQTTIRDTILANASDQLPPDAIDDLEDIALEAILSASTNPRTDLVDFETYRVLFR